MNQLAFYFDSSACSGCKACQVACKDKHGLEVGRIWRRVYEVSGGGWTQVEGAWRNNAFAYHLSIACNHCEKPICAEVCPTRAISKRDDGVVLIDETRCIGCKYCSWACPYGALQFDYTAGTMSKCTFCADELDQGKAPACVAACPLRVLDYGDKAKFNPEKQAQSIAPLPLTKLTEPALHIHAHKDAPQAAWDTPIANREEVSRDPRQQSGGLLRRADDRSLVVFTLLAQMAVGAFLVLFLLSTWLANELWLQAADTLTKEITLAILTFAGIALLSSLFHLGKPMSAWRAFANLRFSWLSREILLATLFTTFTAIFAGLQWMHVDTYPARIISGSLALICGLALTYNMTRVYTMRTVPAWNTAYTGWHFFAATILLGGLFTGSAYTWIWPTTAESLPLFDMRFQSIVSFPAKWLIPVIAISLIMNGCLVLIKIKRFGRNDKADNQRQWARLALFGVGAFAISLLLVPTSGYQDARLIYPIVFGLSLVAETIGRAAFYNARQSVL